nr:hypothetical protein B0A51_05000 [Rachicladosporium sp. CCFEE 5018]
MPRRRNPCSYLPRRLQIVTSLAAFLLFSILFLGTSQSDPYVNAVPYGPQLQSGAHQAVDAAQRAVQSFPKLPTNVVNAPAWLNPFGPPAHKPAEQKNSTMGEAKWFSDWKWQNPFSSSITMDEDRSVLPPERARPPIYTYFDSSSKGKDEKTQKAEKQLLQIWRRAWWAKGFKPIVLGIAEAKNNAEYRKMQGLELTAEMEAEMLRWLAWGNLGTGILCNWLVLPMAGYDDALLGFLRRGEYPELTRYPGLDGAFYVGSKVAVDKTIKTALASESAKQVKTIVDAVPKNTFILDDKHDGIAYYSTAAVKAKYPTLHAKLDSEATRCEGLSLLAPLINSHLHQAWQNTFPSGIAVLHPLPKRTTTIHTPAMYIARNLTQCPDSPVPASCPPNVATCRPCVATQERPISTPPVYRNSSTLFTIASVPHPYTLISLLYSRSDLHVKFVRRETDRDPWISATTDELLGKGPSSFARLRPMKDAVASEYSAHRTLWLLAEKPLSVATETDREELDWFFGFQLPRSATSNGKSITPVPGPERRPPPPPLSPYHDSTEPPPTSEQLATEESFLRDSTAAIMHAGLLKAKNVQRNRGVVEAWNLADAEIWRFVRAWEARRSVERKLWDEEEGKFLGKGVFGRWAL